MVHVPKIIMNFFHYFHFDFVLNKFGWCTKQRITHCCLILLFIRKNDLKVEIENRFQIPLLDVQVVSYRINKFCCIQKDVNTQKYIPNNSYHCREYKMAPLKLFGSLICYLLGGLTKKRTWKKAVNNLKFIILLKMKSLC